VLTILMPCRNVHAGFLDQALASVFAQTSPEWELVVIDDGSDEPATLDALGRLAARRDGRVRVVASRGRLVTGALNTGMAEARTPFVCTLHCDDALEPTAVEVMRAAIAAGPGVDYFHSSRRFVDEAGRPISSVYLAEQSFAIEEFERRCPVKCLHCWRVDVAQSIGGMDESLGLHGADDWDFAWRMAEAGVAFGAVPDCLYVIRDHREHFRLTTHVPLDAQVAQVVRILRKHGVAEDRIGALVEERTSSHLQQALYASEDDRRRKERNGFDPRTGWREPKR
jgi:glycosyltransferase involved in cell wall biosynthesis